jgi:UDP-N-acetylglucosamine 2-epimerase (non-hydrolysing)
MAVAGTKRVMCVFGTRPEAIKTLPLVLALRDASWCDPIVAVTAQHRGLLDPVMAFFGVTADEDLDLFADGQTLAALTARCVTGLDDLIVAHQPDAIVVQGDTTSAFAGALAGFYRQVPVVHLEAGLRTDDRMSPFPEEVNRRLVTQLASLHLAPTTTAAAHLRSDGVDPDTISITGNTVIDALRFAVARQDDWGDEVLKRAVTNDRRVVVVTAHRRESWGAPMQSLGRALAALSARFPDVEFVFPIHPNPIVRNAVMPFVADRRNVTMIEPLPYGSFSRLLDRSTLVLTDSGGVQEEAPSLGKPVLVLRDTTERPEAIAAGTARLIGTDEDRIIASVSELLDDSVAYDAMANAVNPYGDGRAVERSVAAIGASLGIGHRLPEFSS